MAKGGNRKGSKSSHNSFPSEVLFGLVTAGPDETGSLFLQQAMPPRIMVIRVKEITKGKVDIGLRYPNEGSMKFIATPTRIKNELLSPTDNNNFRSRPIPLILSAHRI